MPRGRPRKKFRYENPNTESAGETKQRIRFPDDSEDVTEISPAPEPNKVEEKPKEDIPQLGPDQIYFESVDGRIGVGDKRMKSITMRTPNGGFIQARPCRRKDLKDLVG